MISSERIAQAITGAKSTCGGLPFPLDGCLAINEKTLYKDEQYFNKGNHLLGN